MMVAERVFKVGFAPVLSTRGLTALREACLSDDVRLVQGSTTVPPPLMCVQDWLVEAACALGFCGWQGEGRATVGDVTEYFGAKCFQADEMLGEPAACRWFLNWFDDTPRPEMLKTLAEWIDAALAERGATLARQPDLPNLEEQAKYFN